MKKITLALPESRALLNFFPQEENVDDNKPDGAASSAN
jgi:hypothetical protein